MKITDKEYQILELFIKAGIDAIGQKTAEALIEQNMTYMSASDLVEATGYSKQAIGGIMASLSNKWLIVDTEESARGATDTDWFASDLGIELYFEMQ